MNYDAIDTFQHRCLIGKSNVARHYGFGWSSSNWSGYALSGKKGVYRRISAEWTVPFVRPTSGSSYSSAWIGIDGFHNSNLIQTGTGHDFVQGRPHYYAWWEILPYSETVIPLEVQPGDCIRAVITKRSRSNWLISLRNLTQNWTFITIQSYKGPQTSAEWILEAPQVGQSVSRLARLSPVVFDCCRVNGKNPKLTSAEGGLMVQNNTAVATPSRPNQAGDAFLVRVKSSKRSGKPIFLPRKT